ncbi:fibronectin type III domain-containing protein [Paraflavitalea pollutisoli]|uniref:fibronectin type III domain-containing protein n=1 Tax=Paraflavitalea pollutisoli TaxID=3034143 RepID=UPI0023EB5713|nr:hypothetical protein [Paraflavitalea sp. H1-2-19X]
MKQYILFFLIITALRTQAQDLLAGLARPGAKGIFVLTGEVISDVKGPVTAYKIERKAANENDYTIIATLPAVTNVADFKQRALASNNLLPYQQDLSNLRLDSIWHRGKAAGSLSALRVLGYSTPVLAGFNMIWLDEKVKAGQSYQYRVTATGTNYTALSLPVRFNNLSVATPLYQQAVFNKPQRHLQLYWRTTFQDKPDHIETWRSEDNGVFTKVPAIVGYLPGKDSVQYLVKDTSAKAGHLYRYFVKAFDVLGNAAPVSDTITIASLDPLQMPMPQRVKALADSAAQGININWQLPEAAFIKTLTLYRSTNSLNRFQRIADLSATDTNYLDQQVKPATPYFYYFEVEYKTQFKPKRSTSFAASFMDTRLPAPPRQLEATGNKEGVVLTWEHPADNTTGFWLYRAERGQPLQLIRTMIPALDTVQQYTWTDTDSSLRGDRMYNYALKAYSTSQVESSFSDTAVARPLKNLPIPKPPMRVTAYAEDGRIYVGWDAVGNYDANVSGYKLLRGKKATGTSTYTTDTIYCSSNQFADTLVQPNVSYRYSVITQSLLGVQSVPATWATVSITGNKPAAPASLVANKVGTGIQLNWEAPAGSESLQYTVYRYERGQDPVKAGTVTGDAFTDKAATKGHQYFYFIRAITSDNTESDRSNEATIRY